MKHTLPRNVRKKGKAQVAAKAEGGGRRKGHGKGQPKERLRWGPRQKGDPKRHQSRIRGYASNKFRLHVSYNTPITITIPHYKDSVNRANNKFLSGEPSPPLAYGDPVCPEVQHGFASCSSCWKAQHGKCLISTNKVVRQCLQNWRQRQGISHHTTLNHYPYTGWWG